MVKVQSTLDGYSKSELHKIVGMYNLDVDISDAKKTKKMLQKEMMGVGKKKLVDLPSKGELAKTHKMPNGDIHTGKSHTKDSKLVKRGKGRPKGSTNKPKVPKDQPKITDMFAKKNPKKRGRPPKKVKTIKIKK